MEFYLNWSTNLLTIHAPKENLFKQQSLLSIQDSLTRKYESLSKVCDFNKYTLKVLIEMREANAQRDDGSVGDSDDEDDVDDSDSDEDNLMLIRQDTSGTHDNDVEMQTDSGESSDESDD